MDAEIMGEVTRKMLADAAGDESVLTEAQRVERAEQRRGKIVPGQMLMGTWGYDQTNASFYKVLAVNKGFATLLEYRTARYEAPGAFMQGTTVPTDEPVGKPFRRKVHFYEWDGSEAVMVTSYLSAKPWNGKPVSTSWYA